MHDSRLVVGITRRLLALLVHALLRRHWVRALLLLLKIGLVLQRLLMVGGHVGLRAGIALHAGLRYGLWHWRCGVVGLFRRVNGRLAIYAISVCGFGSIQTGL